MANKNVKTDELEEVIEGKTLEMYKNVDRVQHELGKIEALGRDTNNLVEITLTGQHILKNIFINKQEPKEILEKAILEAHQNAKDKMEKLVKQKMIEISEALGFYQ